MIKYFDTFVYRAPLLPISDFQKSKDFPSIDHYLRDILSRAEVQEALFISSPDFFAEVEKFLIGSFDEQTDSKRMVHFRTSALKYINRMSSRSTPFGLFAACGTGKITNDIETEVVETEYTDLRRWAKLDVSYLIYFSKELIKKDFIKAALNYYPNNTIYKIGNKSRYVEFFDSNVGRAYNLSLFTDSEFITKVLDRAKQGGNVNQLAQTLVTPDIELAAATAFVEELIEAKILISELEPRVVGESFQDQLISIMDRLISEFTAAEQIATVKQYRDYLAGLIHELATADSGQKITRYRNIYDKIKGLHGTGYKNYMQVNSQIEAAKPAVMPASLAQDIQRGIKYLAKFCTTYANPRLTNFKYRFQKRYDKRMVPLLEVLDPELGIGFGTAGSESSSFAPLVDSLPIPKAKGQTLTKSINWDYDFHSFLFDKIQLANQKGEETIQFTKRDIEKFGYDLNRFSPTFTAVVSIVPRKDKEPLICFHEHGKDSATAMLTRFAEPATEMHDLVEELSDFEASCYEHEVVAEINHLSDLRSGNITERPKTRRYEIPYVTKSNSTEEGLIEASDIYLGLRGGRLILFSKHLNKEIVPRLSNAHNYFYNCLPFYNFLASLQEEHDGGYYEFVMNLGAIPSITSFVPRLQYKQYVFRPATWTISSHDLKKFKNFPMAKFGEKTLAYFIDKGYPTVFFLKSGGSPMYIDLENPGAVYVFADAISKGETITFSESLYEQGDDYFLNRDGEGAFHELIVPFRNEKIKANNANRVAIKPNLKQVSGRSVTPSAEWLYFKVYAGVNNLEKIVSERLPILTKELQDKGLISQYFFLRYTDPDHHIRIRFALNSVDAIADVVQTFNQFFAQERKSRFIWKIQIDTYEREIERYGADLIEAAEDLFCLDSELVIRLKSLLTGEVNKDQSWLLCMAIMEIYLKAFDIDKASKIGFLKERRSYFSSLFRTDKRQKRDLMMRFKANNELIKGLLEFHQLPFSQANEFRAILAQFSADLSALHKDYFAHLNSETKLDLVSSFIHMSILRFVNCKNQLHEHVLFFLLERYYYQQEGLAKARQKRLA